ncbi:MAG: RDD family protein [Calditrichaeota bacterium]|nr:MAG: RDD family protein [Calditrichota bacterium]
MHPVNGVFFQTRDYGSIGRRFLAAIIDIMILVVVFFILSATGQLFSENWAVNLLIFVFIVFTTVYLTWIKKSPLRTLGYRLAGIKIVTLQNKPPSLVTMFFRLLLMLFYPFQFPIDTLWLINDPHRQSLRDKLTCTYVIREDTIPVGERQIICVNYCLLGFNFLFKEVK